MESRIAVHFVGPNFKASRRLAAAYMEEERGSQWNVIDIVWNKDGGGSNGSAARQQLRHELQQKNGYISIGNLVDVTHSTPAKHSPVQISSNNLAAELFLPYVKNNNEVDQILHRYRCSLFVLIDCGPDSPKEVNDTITRLHQLCIPFYQMQEPDLSAQVSILQHAVKGELPSPFASLSFYEQLSSKSRNKKSGNKNDLDTFFDTFNLPFYLGQNKGNNVPENGVRSLFISESELRQTIETPVKGRTNRFLHRRGGTDDLFLIEFDRGIASSIVMRLLQAGLRIQGYIYSFLGCSSSGLKKRKAYMIKGCEQVAVNERQKNGDFQSLKTVSKQISRFSLLLTNVVITNVIPDHVKVEADVEANKHCFTDGCGTISPDIGKALIRESRETLARRNEVRFEPSVFQVRKDGVKGIVVIDSSLPNGTMVVRPSMCKFDTDAFPEICICDYSRPYSFGHLNLQYITLLSGLGVPDENFLSVQRDYFELIKKMTHDFDSALSILEWHNRSDELLGEDREENLSKLKSLQTQLICMSPKLKILVPESRTMFGVAETPRFCPKRGRLPGILKYGECMVRVTMKGGEKITLQNQRVVVSKNPCYLLGDVRVLRAVSPLERPELSYLDDLVDCLVFPINGDTPHSEEIAGSDLDGDQYFVCWDERLIPPRVDQPYSYPSFQPKKAQTSKPKQIDLVKYFSGQNIVSDLTGRVDSNYKAWAAIKGPASDECQRLGQLFSRVVDSAKSGEAVKLEQSIRVPKENRPVPKATSKFVWQKMQHHANVFVERQMAIGNLNITDDRSELSASLIEADTDAYYEDEIADQQDLLFDMCARNHLTMSEFTKFRLIMQHLNGNIEAFFRSKFASIVNFGHFNEFQLGFVVHNYHVPQTVLSDALSYYSRIMQNQAVFFRKYVDKNHHVPWKLYWRTETDAGQLYFADVLLHALRKNTDALLIMKLPDSVAVILRFSIPFQDSKTTRQAILFTEQSTCIEEQLKNFINVNSVFASRNFGLADEYTLIDKTYHMAIDMNNKSLQIYRGEKRATFAHLRVDEMTSGSSKRVLLSVDLTRFDRRILNGRRRHPLVRKAPVLDMELFVSNRSSPYATGSKKISLADVLIDDGSKWEKSSPPFQDPVKSNACEDIQLQKDKCDEMLNTIQRKFMTLGSMCSRRIIIQFQETVLYQAHKFVGMSDQVSLELQMGIESLSAEIVSVVTTRDDTNIDEKLLFLTTMIPILSDLGINMSLHRISAFEDLDPDIALNHLIRFIRKWDIMLALSNTKREEVLSWFKTVVGPIDNPAAAFARKNVLEQAQILLHEMEEGSEDIRSSSCASRLVNLRIEPNVSMFDEEVIEDEGKKSKGKTPTVTFYSMQAMPVGLGFAKGEHVRIFKQPTSNLAEESPREFSIPQDCYDDEFPALSTATSVGAKSNANELVSKNMCCCLGRVMSVTEAPFSVKIKILPPSYIANSSYVPQPIEDCLRERKDVWFELQVVPANVVAHERIIDSISLVLDPKEGNNLFVGTELCGYLMGCPSVADEMPVNAKASQTSLNSRQREALEKSVSNILSLVHGPPGTGKTTTIIHIIKEILQSSNHRILVSAETNLAVDNLALRMIAQNVTAPGELIRVGSGDKVDDKLKSIHLEAMVKGKIPKNSAHDADTDQNFYLSKHKKIMNEILGGARVIFATSIGAGDPILKGQKLEIVIMDEASMSTEPSCLPALSHGCSRLVMVGDHKQLGPHACDSKCVSLFERLLLDTESKAIPAAITMLNQQHRMHSNLCQFPSKTFYESKLLTANGIDKARPIPRAVFQHKSPIKFVAVENGREQRMKSGSWYNEVEIGYVLEIINELTNKKCKDNLKGEDITILTPYRAQQARIQLQLRNIWRESDPAPEVCSIDGYQGRENEIIVFSAVRCGSSLGFCDDARRINVLLTRAKRGLVVVGDRGTLIKSRIWREWMDMVAGM